MDLKSLVSIILYNPVLHNTAGHAPHAYVSSVRIKIYKEENFFLELIPDTQQTCVSSYML